MPKKNKFWHKWIFDPEMSKYKETGIFCLTYKEEKGMYCWLCRMTNTLQPSNNSTVWNSKSSTRFRTEAVRDHFNKTRDVKTMHGDAMSILKIRCGTYFVENEKKEECVSSLRIKNFFSLWNDVRFFYWLWREEVTRYWYCK